MKESHPVADIFPMLPPDELRRLSDDISARGLLEPVVLLDDMILDGRNRYAACKLAGVTPDFVTFSGDDALGYVIAKNLHRRHLNESQRAVAASRIANMTRGEFHGNQHVVVSANLRTPTISQPEAAAMMKISTRSVQSVNAIERDAPELITRIDDGEITVHEAAKIVRKQHTADREQEALSHVSGNTDWIVTDDQTPTPCDVLITDPPYGILDEVWEPEDLRVFTINWLSRWNDCGADLILSFWSQEFLFDGRSWFDTALTNYDFQQVLVWHYPNNKKHNSPKLFKYTWEPIFVYRRTGSDRPVTLSSPEWGDELNSFDCHVSAVPQSNFNDVNFKQHPAQKPLSVMLWLVNAVTQPSELVCDPFCGSGTTGIAAIQLGRRFYGIEIDQSMLDIAKGRIATYGK